MEIEFDPKKSAKNEEERSLPFEFVRELEWGKARITAMIDAITGRNGLWLSSPRTDDCMSFVFACVRR
jgi:uncharacterized DUF497 family protein